MGGHGEVGVNGRWVLMEVGGDLFFDIWEKWGRHIWQKGRWVAMYSLNLWDMGEMGSDIWGKGVAMYSC